MKMCFKEVCLSLSCITCNTAKPWEPQYRYLAINTAETQEKYQI